MLGTIDTAMLAASAAKAEHQAGEASLDITRDMCICQLVNTLQEGQNLSIILKETDDWLVKSRQLLVGFITSRVVCAAAIKNISSAIATCILWDAFLIGETEHANHQGTLCVIT